MALVLTFLNGVGALFDLNVELLLKLQEVLMDVLQFLFGVNSLILQEVILIVHLCPVGGNVLELLVLSDRILNLPMDVVNLFWVKVQIVKKLWALFFTGKSDLLKPQQKWIFGASTINDGLELLRVVAWVVILNEWQN